MKITDVRAVPLAIPMSDDDRPSPWWGRQARQVIVLVETDAGLTGLGEAFALGGQVPVCRVVEDTLRPLLVGQDPTRVEHLAALMQRSVTSAGRRGLALYAVSGAEIALWDLLGKHRGVPLYELLGGLTHARLPAYASLLRYATPEQVAVEAARWAGRGFGAVKLHQVDVASVRAAREAVGPDVDVMLDTNCPWTPVEARVMARALAPYQLAWLEEPIWPPEDYEALADLRRHAPMPIALGENEATVYGFREILAKGAADVLQPSVVKAGGIGELKRIAALAAAANVRLVPHSFYFGPGLAATLHVMASLPEATLVELPAFSYAEPLLAEPIAARDGWLAPPDGPGLGVALNEEAVRRYALAG